MEKITSERLKQIQLSILDDIHSFCTENGLNYSLCGGTLLGAVRHKGYIPWDDDIDLMMPREDYERFIRTYTSDENYLLDLRESDVTVELCVKVCRKNTSLVDKTLKRNLWGVNVDIFPIDGIPSDKAVATKHLKKYKFWRHLLFFRGRDPFKHGKGPRSWWPLLIHKMYSLQQLQDKVQRLMTQYKFDDCDQVIDYDSVFRGIVAKKILGEPKEYEFEGKKFLGVSDAHQYLTEMYGDYMTPPPKEKQIQHNFYYINLELPYREFAKQNNITIA